MKKVLIMCCSALAAAAAAAQNTTAESVGGADRGDYAPAEGYWGVSVGAAPLLTYFGNFFGKTDKNDAPTLNGVDGGDVFGTGTYALAGKYFLQDDRALRARLLVNAQSVTNKYTVKDDYRTTYADPVVPDATAVDAKSVRTTGVGLAVGYEFRKGRGRVDAFYGGELALGFARTTSTYNYGNPMTLDNPDPTTDNNLSQTSVVGSSTSGRTTLEKGGLTLNVGIGGFAGVDFFIVPQVSLGAELGLMFLLQSTGQSETTTQQVEAGQVLEKTTRQYTGNEINSVGLKTNASAQLFLSFYF